MGTNVRWGAGPPVVFIAQLGTEGDSWQPVVDLLPGITTVTYDRPGTGDAPPRPAPNPPLPHSALARELADLLDRHRVVEPAVLAGHSLGGNIARVYAGLRPDRVAGLVFVDSSIPQSFLYREDQEPIDGDGPDATLIDTVAGQVEIMSAPIPKVPAVVLTRRRHWWPAGIGPIPNPAIDDLWHLSQRQLAEQCGAPMIVTGAGHQVPAEAPELVAHAIRAVHAAAAGGEPVRLDPAVVARAGGELIG